MLLSVEQLVVQSALAGDQLLGGSLRVDAGGVTGVIGHRDGGSAALFDSISGQVKPDSGQILWHDSAGINLPGNRSASNGNVAGAPLLLHQLRPDQILRVGIARVGYAADLFAGLSLKDNLLLGASHRTLRPAIRSDLEDLLELIPELNVRRAVAQLSALECALASIGRAMMSQPRLMLLQDPLRGLPANAADRVAEVLAAINGRNVALLIAASSLEGMPMYPDRIYHLRNSQITERPPLGRPLQKSRVLAAN